MTNLEKRFATHIIKSQSSLIYKELLENSKNSVEIGENMWMITIKENKCFLNIFKDAQSLSRKKQIKIILRYHLAKI